MKLLTSFMKKLILLIISSVIAATFIIFITAETSNKNAIYNEAIKKKKEVLQTKINKLEHEKTRIKNSRKITNPPKKRWWHTLKRLKAVEDIVYNPTESITDKINSLYKEMNSLEYLPLDASKLDVFIVRMKLNCFKYSLYIFLLLVFSPILVSLFTYYVIARLVEKSAPITALKKEPNTENIDMKKARAALVTELSGDEHLYLRGGWKGATDGLRARTKFMWKWSAPLITFAADLFELVDFSVEKDNGSITITAPEPDLYIGEIILSRNRAIVIRPRHLIGITNGIKIKTVWNFKLHNILAGKIRQVILYGNGRIFIYGTQGIEENNAIGKDYKIEAYRMLGYDAHAAYSLCRTETWWHYYRKEAVLFDVKIQKGVFLTQTISRTYTKADQNGIEKCVNFILNGIGSFLGL